MSKHWKPAKRVFDEPHGDISRESLRPETRIIADVWDRETQPDVVPLASPIYPTGTFKYKSVEHYLDIVENGGYIYTRMGNPTIEVAEAAINALENGAGTLAFSSGSSAVMSATLGNLKCGDHMIACNPLYSGMHKMFDKFLPLYGIEVTFVPTGKGVAEYEKHIKKNTKLLWGETPCNPSLDVLDLAALGGLGLKYNLITCVDSTFGSPALQNPISHGIDISMHSCTKYIGGHNDITAGCLTLRSLDMWRKLNSFRATMGNILSPFEANLMSRGMKTLILRMKQHSESAMILAQYLEGHPKIQLVSYPGLPSHPAHHVAKKQMSSFGGMVVFEVKGGLQGANNFMQKLTIINMAVSLGSVESIVTHPASMTHGPMIMTDQERLQAGITPGQIRFSVGLEHPEDLKADLQQALKHA